MALARPYNKYGQLKPQWKEAIEMIHKESGLVTAQKLLGSYQASLINAGPALDKPVHSLYTPKIKEGITILRPKPIQLKASKKEDMSSNLSSMKLPELSDHTALVKKEISKKEPTGQRVVTSKPPSGPNLIRKLAPILNTILIKEELKPEEIPLPLSPISEPGSPRTTAPYSQCTAEGSGIGVVRPSKADSVTTPDTTQSVLLSTQYSIVSTSSSSALKSETTTDAFYCPTNNSSSEVRHISVQIDSSDPPAKGSLIKPKTKFRLKKKSINYINQL
ncbi:uncharacterized protein N7484_001267 [Penicillium longicatenatum]|uniref:uncharacterized protein n=1 Tax=Penicillium longicatenatum TaxID=1561947 RepID=UPI00254814E8|nr:uncharacterized protein N7484_001267 [Penicillium longicatenatum]KAJ5657618.1 hypothetical protein N7484_001267 [Penicillium longicatenatum]